MGDNPTNKTDSIIATLKNGPKSINEVAEEVGINWRTAESRLEQLEKLGIVIKKPKKRTRIYLYKDGNNYFGLYVKKEDKKFISSVYHLIRKTCLKNYNKEPTKTHVYKILWKLKKDLNLNIPIGWYLHGPCAVQVYSGNEAKELPLDKKTEQKVKEATQEYCKYDNVTLQNKIYEEDDNQLYKLKEKLKEGDQNLILMDLIKLVPEEAVDITTDFTRATLMLGWDKTKDIFDKLWNYIAILRLKDTLRDYYGDSIDLYLDEKTAEFKKETQLMITDLVRTYVNTKHSQEK